MRRFAKPLYWLKPVPGVRIPPSPPEYSHHIVNIGVPASFAVSVTTVLLCASGPKQAFC